MYLPSVSIQTKLAKYLLTVQHSMVLVMPSVLSVAPLSMACALQHFAIIKRPFFWLMTLYARQRP